MTGRRPIDVRTRLGRRDEPPLHDAAPPELFRDLLAHWASGIGVVAVRDEGRVYATTVTSFAPVAAEPPLVLVSLGPTAQVLPFLDRERPFVVNLLAADQRLLATVFADAFPVGPSPFPEEGDPVVEGALAFLRCRVVETLPAAPSDVSLVLGEVLGGAVGDEGSRGPLLNYRRGYHTLP